MDSILGALDTKAGSDGIVENNPADLVTQKLQGQGQNGLMGSLMNMNSQMPNMAQQQMNNAMTMNRPPPMDWSKLLM